ncbi:hypothetical protein [Alicyclobacillus kakegawensis]|uniref:hypothetical protein n=1 Tax=Alicyclobacillus kakegawensis TaxID=392012 RepID=UPI00082FDF15|nr:hypothetical protein [Alicyclobacillus kakegawensis]
MNHTQCLLASPAQVPRKEGAAVRNHGSKRNREAQAKQKTRARRKAQPLPAGIRPRLNREASRLGMNTEEYLNLLLTLSETLRGALAQEDHIDAKPLLELMQNPWFRTMLQWVCKSAVSIANGNGEPSEVDEGQHPPQAPDTPPRQPMGPAMPPYAERPRAADERVHETGPALPGPPQPHWESRPPLPGWPSMG